MISSTRRSDNRTNSSCLNADVRRGVSTTPANCDRFDRSCAAVCSARCGSPARSWPSMLLVCWCSSGCSVSSVSTK